MNVTEPIIQAALLGTANREFVPGAFPESLQTLVDGIHGKAEDTESFLYMTAASAFAYRRAGWEPAGAEGIVPVKTAPEEELPYFDKDRGQLFSRLHGTRYMLAYAYRLAQGSGKIISPEYLQPLIRRAYDRNNPLRFEERRLLKNLVGNRGLWLIRQMGLVGEECGITDSWDTATHGERKEMLARFRKLLCMIPDSAMVMRCCELLRGHIRHNMLTGWSYDEIGYTPEMKAMGLSEVSSNKKEGDSEFILRQLAERVPLSFWCEVYGCGKEEAARKFAKHPPFRKFLELEDPILNFSDGLWAFHTLKEDPSYLRKPELVAMLTPSQREEISWPETVRDFGFIPDSWYGNDYEAWGPKFSSSVMSWILKKDYLYYAADMAERLAMHIPSHLRNLIKAKAASSAEASPSMNEFCSKMLEFMDLKSEIDTLLNEK